MNLNKILEKLVENVVSLVEEEYNNINLSNEDYKDVITDLLKVINSDDSPLFIWTGIFAYLTLAYREGDKELRENIEVLEDKLLNIATELGF